MKINRVIGSLLSGVVIVGMITLYTGVQEAYADDVVEDYVSSAPEVSLRPQARPTHAPATSLRPQARPELPESVFDEAQQKCLAQNIYYESRGEILEGQEAIAWVTLNRVMDDHFPDTICDVVTQRNQFSWVRQVGMDSRPGDSESWDRAVAVASFVTHNYAEAEDVTDGATFFHASRMTPGWFASLNRTGRIGNHTFYRL